MIRRFQYKDATWIDIQTPTEEETRAIMEEFAVNPNVISELIGPSMKSRVELHKNYIYMILHFPVFKHSHADEMRQEVDFIVGKNFVITVRYDTIDAIEKFTKIIEVNSILDRGIEENCTTILFFGIIAQIYQSLANELDYIEGSISSIEQAIFEGREKDMVFALSQVGRNLLNFKKSTDFHSEVLTSLDSYGRTIFDEHFSYHTRKIQDEFTKIKNLLNNNIASVRELRETNDSILSTKQNEIMKTLTVMAFVTFPLTLMAAIFSMDTKYTPIVGMENDFWIVMGIMAFAGVCMFSFFKYKKWF